MVFNDKLLHFYPIRECLHSETTVIVKTFTMKIKTVAAPCHDFESATTFLRERRILRRAIPLCSECSREMSENFVDPVTLTHTNSIECMWKNAKRKFKAMLEVQSTMLPFYLDEFMSRQRYGNAHQEAFDNMLSHSAE